MALSGYLTGFPVFLYYLIVMVVHQLENVVAFLNSDIKPKLCSFYINFLSLYRLWA